MGWAGALGPWACDARPAYSSLRRSYVGHNRSGVKARLKLRRRRKEAARLVAKEAGAQGKGAAPQEKKPAGAGQTAGG